MTFSDGTTALHIAARTNNADLIYFFAVAEVNVQAENDQKNFALHHAATKIITQFFVRKRLYQNQPNITNDHSLHVTSYAEREDVTQILLKSGAEIDAINHAKYTALKMATKAGQEPVERLLLAHKADTELQTSRKTALMIASKAGHVSMVRLLLDHGANLDARLFGRTALVLASKEGHEPVMRLLLDHGANPDSEGFGMRVVTIAAKAGHDSVIRLLIERGANVSQQKYGETALMAASEAGHESVMRTLIETRASVENKNDEDMALKRAWRAGHKSIVQVLLKNGAIFDAYFVDDLGSEGFDLVIPFLSASETFEGKNPRWKTAIATSALLGAVQGRRYESMVKFLLDDGADSEAKDKNQDTALTTVAQRGPASTMKVLLEHGADIEAKG